MGFFVFKIGGDMTALYVKDIVQRLERAEKQNLRYKLLNVIAIFIFFVLMIAPQLSAIPVLVLMMYGKP